MTFYFKNTKKKIIMTEEDEEDYRIINVCRFCEKSIKSDKFIYHCYLTSKNICPAHSICNNIVTLKQNNFLPFPFHNLVTTIVVCFSEN